MTDKPVERAVALDYLRVFAVLLVVAHHAALAYAPFAPKVPSFTAEGLWWRAFPIVDTHGSDNFTLFIAFNDTFFMSLLFLLSGLFVASSFASKGFGGFTGRRLVRLGIPFIFAAGIIAPLAYLPTYLQLSPGGDLQTFWQQWLSLPVWPAGPAWFVWVLLAFDLVAALLFLIMPGWARAVGRIGDNADRRPFRFFLILATLSAILYTPLLILYGSWHWAEFGPFSFQTSRILHYVLYFAMGVGLGSLGTRAGLFDPQGNLAKRWWMWGGIAFIAFALVIVVLVGSTKANGQQPMFWNIAGGITFALSCATSSFAFLALFLKFFKRPIGLLDNLARNSYGIYLVHYAFVNWMLYVLLPAQLSPGAKFGIAFAGAALLSWITASLLRRIPGVKRVL